MKYLHKIYHKFYTNIYHKRNEEILEELHGTPLEDKLCTNRQVVPTCHGMEDNRLPKQLLNYDHLRDY
jgi:hypothetical protein